ncbi:MAG: helix-turn-helix domain-containing protein [Firmicutes bacterium]|nr:helix-turn-helix domain-containing protein [Bacillota bacterium]
MDTIGERITYLRDLRDMKQKDLAETIGVTKATMSKYENNINIPNADILCRIADALNTSADYLVGRTPQMRPYTVGGYSEFSPEALCDIISKLNKENKIRIFERAATLLEEQNNA